ncbi:MAG: hypothetical protein R3233_07140, partial [Xanthomonadales bacterium]|nr:hypothetical protein [Xanthomonadales bacterium]
ENGELTGWVPTWDEPEMLPVSVALDIQFVEEVYIRWPLLTASVRTDPTALNELAGEMGGTPTYGTSIRDLINRRKNRE